MKRYLSILCLIVTLLCLFPVSSTASDGTSLSARKGTPVLDGCMDPMYASSCNFRIGLDPYYVKRNITGSPDSSMGITQGDCYVLWDDNYLYFYCTSYDSNLVYGDAVALYFMVNSEYWAIGYYPAIQKFMRFDTELKGIYFDVANCKAWNYVSPTGDYYAVEMAIPFYNLGANTTIGFHYGVTDGVSNHESFDAVTSTSGFFLNDRLQLLSTPAVDRTLPFSQILPESPLFAENGFLLGADGSTTLAEIRACFVQQPGDSFYDTTDSRLSDSDTAKSGITLGTKDTGLTLVVSGDLNGNGRVESNDYILARRAVLQLDTAGAGTAEKTAAFYAADVNRNGEIDTNDLSRIRMYQLGLLSDIRPKKPETAVSLNSPAERQFGFYQWFHGAQYDTPNHVLLAFDRNDSDCFGGGLSTTLDYGEGYYLNNVSNDFERDSYRGRLAVSDPMYREFFRSALYDYTYSVILIAMPKMNTESSTNYLNGLISLLKDIKQFQPTAHVAFVNVFEDDTSFSYASNVKTIMSMYGAAYLDYSGFSPYSVEYYLNRYILKQSGTLRTEKPEGALSATELAQTRESMYFAIYDIEDADNIGNRDRALIIGDSIANGYYKNVRKNIWATTTVDAFITSMAPADYPTILRNLKPILEKYDYKVIHINIGLHYSTLDMDLSNYTNDLYTANLRALLEGIREMEPDVEIVFATSTPKNVKSYGIVYADKFDESACIWIRQRNTWAKTLCDELGITVNDLYALCLKYTPAKEDELHFSDQSYFRDAVSEAILTAIQKQS